MSAETMVRCGGGELVMPCRNSHRTGVRLPAECRCYETPPSQWTRYGSAIEPGSQLEWNPTCLAHPSHAGRHRLDRHTCFRTFVEVWRPANRRDPEGTWVGYRGTYWRRWL